DNNCICHTKWEGKEITNNINPLSGQCICNKDLDFQCVVRTSDYFELNCVKGFCDPFKTDNSKNCNEKQSYKDGNNNSICCQCPPGYLRCPDDLPHTNESLIQYCLDNGPLCILDPCSTETVPNGYFDSKLSSCICGDLPNIVKQDENSAVGQICVDGCKGN